MVRWFYSLLLMVLSPGLLAWMALRARRAGGDWAILGPARFGRYRQSAADETRPVWVHAVSLGEMRACTPLVRALLARGHRVLLTHLTASGRAEGLRLFGEAIAGGQLQQAWIPYDFCGATRRFMRHYAPAVGVLVERELWPNLVHAAARERVPLVLASARLSRASLRRTLRLGALMRHTYGLLTQTYAQTLMDARRLERAGAHRVSVSGNFKFDVQPDEGRAARGRQFAAAVGRPIVGIASTREGEEAEFVQAVARQVAHWRAAGRDWKTQPLFYLIPRHPQRFELVARLLTQAELGHARRTQLIELGDGSSSAVQACQEVDVLLGDTLGEMAWYYAGCQAAIIGGSFAPLGGQNFIEACALGCPVLVGPHTDNFAQAVRDAIAAGAAARAETPAAALHQAVQWLDDAASLARMGEAGRHWVNQHAGAVDRVMNGIEALLPTRPPTGLDPARGQSGRRP